MATKEPTSPTVNNKELTKVEDNPFLKTISITNYKQDPRTKALLEKNLAETKKAFGILND